MSISSTFYARLLLYESALQSFSLITVWLCIFLAQKYWHKNSSKDVDEIDFRREKVSISSSFYALLLQAYVYPKCVKDTDNLTEFLCFWDLFAKKLHVKRWWNWAQKKCMEVFIWIWSNWLCWQVIDYKQRWSWLHSTTDQTINL